MADRFVDVYLSYAGESILAGRLWSHRRGKSESMTFRYDETFLTFDGAYQLDPELPLILSPQQTAEGRAIFGAFSDSAPDRWGRRLIARNENRRVEREGGAPRQFGEFEFLLGVRDEVRQGALRFHDAALNEFLATESEGVPPLVDLPRLLSAAEKLEDGEEDDEDLAILVRGGSSLGGARPKAHVRMSDGRIAIAKFPSIKMDNWDVMRWEWVALTLAKGSGISVPAFELQVVDDLPVLIIQRFDRNESTRIGYASAMTMLDLSDKDQSSYLEIAEVIITESHSVDHDLEELWRRVIFSILISNFDDHLRNHGFLRTSSAGWALSPAFDMNPDPEPGGRQLETSIDMSGYDASIGLALEVAPEFRLSSEDAKRIIGEVISSTSRWREVAASVGLTKELSLMAPAFEHGEAEEALRHVRSS